MADEKREGKGFTVKDRRSFAHGDSDAEGEPAPGPAPAPDPPGAAQDRGLPEIDFSTFVLSLASSAFYHLGQMPHPETQKSEVNLPLAKQTIDILGMLQSKTRGNLSHDEDKLLENILYDLRLRYVETSRH